jgi:hypothetical protein
LSILGVHDGHADGQLRLGFRSGILRTFALSFGGVSGAGIALGAFQLIKDNPSVAFQVLQKWGFVWLLGLVAMYFGWDLLKRGLVHLGALSSAVQDSAVAISRIADKDDRERDRMITETAFIGQRLEIMASEMRNGRAEQRAFNERMEKLVTGISQARNEEGVGG